MNIRYYAAAAVAFFLAAGPASAGNGDVVADFDLFGRFMLDYTRQTSENTAMDVSEFEIRRARVGFSAKLFGAAKLKAEINTDDSGDVEFTDTYLSFKPGGAPFAVQVGHFKTPNSMDEWGSSRFLTGFERPAFTDAFGFDRRLGVALAGGGERTTMFLGVYAQNLHADKPFGGIAVAGRTTYAPPVGGDMEAHVGASFRYRTIDETEPGLRYRQRAVSHTSERVLSTGRIADRDLFLGIEAAVKKQSFWAVGEYGVTFAECDACVSDPTFDGGYAEAGYMFGGERTLKGGKFDRPSIGDHPLGAVSVFARFDTIDLRDVGVNGGCYDALVGGVEWWPRNNVHVGVNGFVMDAALGTITSGLGDSYANAIVAGVTEDVSKGVLARAQFDF